MHTIEVVDRKRGSGPSANPQSAIRNPKWPAAFLAAALLLPAAALAGAPGAVGDLYVCNQGQDKVEQFDGTTGAYVGDFITSGSGGLDFPRGLTWGPNGNLFVCSAGTDNVKEYDGSTGAFVRDFTATGTGPPGGGAEGGWLYEPQDAVFGPDGALYVSGEGNDAVLRYDGTTGEWLGTFAIGGEDFGGLDSPIALAFGPNGHLFACSRGPLLEADAIDRSVNEYHGATGRLVREFTGNGSVNWIQGLTFRPNGNLLVTSSEVPDDPHLPNVVLEFDGVTGAPLGEFVTDGLGGLNCWASRLTYGPNGNLFVTSYDNGLAIEYEGETGALVGTFANVSSPVGLAFKPAPPDPLPAPTISGVSVSQHDACEPLTGVVVTGTNLDPNATLVMLQDPNEPLGTNGTAVATYVGLVTGDSGDGTSLTVYFDLDGGARMAGGGWDVVVQNPDGQAATLAAAIDITACYTADEGNLFVLGNRHRQKTRYGLFEFDGATGDLIGFVVEDPTVDGDDLGCGVPFCPRGLVFHAGGDILIGSIKRGSVVRYDGVTGRKLGTFIPAGFAGSQQKPVGLTYGPNGNLFVLHRGPAGAGVVEFNGQTGAMVRDFVPVADGCGIDSVEDFHFGPNGDLYVLDDTWAPCDPYIFPNAGVHVFDGVTGACLANPLIKKPLLPAPLVTRMETFAFGPHDGLLYVPTWGQNCTGSNQGGVRAYDPKTGALLGEPIALSPTLDSEVSATLGPNGHLFVSAYMSGIDIISEFDIPDPISGTWLGVFATQTNASGSSDAEGLLFKPLLGDADGDWDRDLADFAALQRAFGGPGVTPANTNDLTFDFDRDGDVDADDFPAFAQRMTPPKDWSAPTGPCCLPDGSTNGTSACVASTTARECVVDLGGSWLGSAGAVCPGDCPAFGACCDPVDGTCTPRTEEQCSYAGGVYQGDGTDCSTAGCPPAGACCSPDDNSCQELTELACLDAGGMYQGDDTECATTTCPFGRYSNEIDPMTSAALAGAGLQLADDLTLEGTGARDLTYLDLRVYGNGGGPFDVTVELWTACPGNGGTLIPGTTFTWNAVPDDGYVWELVADPVDPPVTIPDTVWMVATFSTPQSGWIIAEQAETGFTADLFGKNAPPWGCNYYFGGSPYAGMWANLRCVAGDSKSRSGATGPVLRVEAITPAAMIQAVEASHEH